MHAADLRAVNLTANHQRQLLPDALEHRRYAQQEVATASSASER
jgi:hypothetical protein